jgi:hypothetical protein
MKTFICKIKFGLQETTETKTFRFKTKEELNAFYLGLDAAIGTWNMKIKRERKIN